MKNNKEKKYDLRNNSYSVYNSPNSYEVIRYRHNPFVTNADDFYLADLLIRVPVYILIFTIIYSLTLWGFFREFISLGTILMLFGFGIGIVIIAMGVDAIDSHRNTYCRIPFISHKVVAKTSTKIHPQYRSKVEQLLEDDNFEKEAIESINMADIIGAYKTEEIIDKLYEAKVSQDSYINEVVKRDEIMSGDNNESIGNVSNNKFMNVWSSEYRLNNKIAKQKQKEKERKNAAIKKAEKMIESMDIRAKGYQELRKNEHEELLD